MRLDSEIKKIAESIRKYELRRRDVSKKISKLKSKKKIKEVEEEKLLLEENIFTKINPSLPRENWGRILATDGGVLSKSYHSIDLIVVRAVSALFDYTNSSLEVEYYPSESPPPRVISIMASNSDVDVLRAKGLYRAYEEIKETREALEKTEPDYVFLDGSCAPHPSTRPEPSSPFFDLYKDMISEYKKVYELCTESETELVGVVEDSRGSRFSKILSKLFSKEVDTDFLKDMRDTPLLFDLLSHGERTFPFKYSEGDIPVISDLGPHKKDIYSFYLKTAEFDRPIRIDFLNKKDLTLSERAGKISEVVFALSSQNRMYGIPAPIIEADQRAKLKETDIDLVYQIISDKAGFTPNLFKLRREVRPFG